MVARLQQSHSKSLCFSLAAHQTLSPHLHHELGPHPFPEMLITAPG